MSVSRSTSQVIRFGPFELTLDTGELRKAGRLIKLPPQPSKVLVEIVDRAGRLVTREEIRQKVWGEETFVDFETGLNHCINQIRTALGDNADEPCYVETVPRRGYRFIAPVEKADTPQIGLEDETPVLPATRSEAPPTASDPALPAAVAEERKETFRRLAILLATVVMLTLVIALVHLRRQGRTTRLTEKDTIVLGELTNSTGDPVFDGTLRQALAIELEQSPYLNVLPDRKMMAILKEMGRPESDRFTQDVTREICLRTNSAAYLSGSIAKLGDHYLIGLRALQCETDQTLASGEVEVGCPKFCTSERVSIARLSLSSDSRRRGCGEVGSAQRFPLLHAPCCVSATLLVLVACIPVRSAV